MTGPNGDHPDDWLDDHWRWRPDWAVDRACVWWYLTFDRHPEVAEATEPLRRLLAERPAVDPVPADWLHLTVCEVDFADQLTSALDAVVDAVREAVEEDEVPLELGPLTTMSGAVVLAAGPSRPWAELADKIRSATAATGVRCVPAPTEPFEPHVTVAYVNSRVPRAALLADLDAAVPEIHLQPGEFTLAAVTRRDRHYQWVVQGRAALRTGLPATPRQAEPPRPRLR